MTRCAQAQTVTPDLFSPARAGFVSPQDLPLRRTTADTANDPLNDAQLRSNGQAARRRGSARSRPTACPPRAAPRRPATTRSTASARNRNSIRARPSRNRRRAPAVPPPATISNDAAAACRSRRPRPPTRRRSPPAMAGTVVGQPPRKRLRIDDDPFGAVGDYAGSFLIKSAVELSGGYDTNPGRTFGAAGSPFYVVAPEFLAVSDWERHALVADLRGSFTGYSNNFPPRATARSRRRRRISTGRISSAMSMAVSMSAATPACSAQARLRVATDNPGSPNVQAGLAKYPVYTHVRRHLRRRSELQPPAAFRRRHRRPHRLSLLAAHRRHLDQQRRPQLQPVRRPRPRQLRSDAGPETVRRNRRRHPLARPAARPQRLSAQFHRRLCQGRHRLRVLAAADRRNRGRLGRARL